MKYKMRMNYGANKSRSKKDKYDEQRARRERESERASKTRAFARSIAGVAGPTACTACARVCLACVCLSVWAMGFLSASGFLFPLTSKRFVISHVLCVRAYTHCAALAHFRFRMPSSSWSCLHFIWP